MQNHIKQKIFTLFFTVASIFGVTGTTYAGSEKTTNERDFEVKFTRLSKQKVTAQITTNNPHISKYEVTFYQKEKGYARPIGEFRTCVIPNKKTHVNSITNKGLYSVGASGYVDIEMYIDGKKDSEYYHPFTKLDSELGVKIQSISDAKKSIAKSISSHDQYITTVVRDTAPSDLFWQAIRNSKWELHDEWLVNVGISEDYYFTYQGKSYLYKKTKMKYTLTKSKDSKLRKKYLSISKKAKGSSKSKVKYFVSYITKNCSYKKTDAPTTYEFLITKKRGQCMHYAIAFAELCKLSGVKCEYVTGKMPGGGKHAWNIVKIGKKWYWCDPCWADSGKKVNKRWMLKGYNSKDFKKRKLDKKYQTTAWKKAHPLGKSLKY